MSDPYREATRSEPGGKGTIPRAVLLTGGAFMALLIGVGVWMAVGRGGSFDQSPEAAAHLNYREATVRAAAAAAVLQAPEPRTGLRVGLTRGLADVRQLEAAMAEVMGSILEDEGYTVTPRAEGPDIRLRVEHPTIERTSSIRMHAVSDKLVSVAQGARLLDRTPHVVSWVPMYPGAQRFVVSGSHTVGSMNYLGFVVKAGAEEIVDWYEDVANLIERDATDPAHPDERRVTTVRMGPDGRVRGRFAMKWDDRLVSLVITEDEYGDSLVALIFRG